MALGQNGAVAAEGARLTGPNSIAKSNLSGRTSPVSCQSATRLERMRCVERPDRTDGLARSEGFEPPTPRFEVWFSRTQPDLTERACTTKIREAAPTRTFEALAARYLKEHAERHKRPRSAEEDRRNLAVHVLPKWAKRDFRAVRRADVIELIESIVGTGRHAAGNRVHSLISKIFSFAIDADLLEANPAARLRKRGVEKVGRRVLDDAEIKTFWRGIVLPPVSRQVGLALRLALLTAARASEIAGARKTEFQDLDKFEQVAWLIPGERAKNKLEHLVPLAPLAVETVKNAIELSGDSEFLFPTRLGRGGPIGRHTLTVAMVRFAKSLKGPTAKTWHQEIPTPHDLRRSCNSRLARMGIPKEIRDRTLNHITSLRDPESKHYNLYEFQAEKREALGKWADVIATIIKPAAIVPMRAVKGRR